MTAILFETTPRGGGGITLSNEERVPRQVKRATEALAAGRKESANGSLVEDDEGHVWMVRRISAREDDFGVLAIDLGQAGKMTEAVRERIDAVLADATETLEHLDLGRALSDARVRSETEALRDALIGSVLHQLRTPLVSILGAATVISQAPGNRGDPRLASLAEILCKEVHRLNDDVQDLLDAALIASKGVRLDCGWIEPADLINTTLDQRQRLLAGHRVLLDIPSELPFIYADAILLEQAFGQIVENAAKYSPPGSTIIVAARTEG
jgi:two-component system, OmpR family, sensor histidine kinase KdpD